MSPQSSGLRITLIGLASLAIAMGIGRFAFTPLLPLMRDDGLIGVTDGGALASVHFVGYAVGAVLATRFHHAPKTTLRLSLITIGLSTLAMGMTDSVLVWMVLRWLCGVCSAFALVLVSSYYIGRLAKMGRAEKQGWIFSGVGAGIAVAGLGALAAMADEIGSALSWRIFGVVSLIAAFAVCRQMGAEIPEQRVAVARHKSARTPLVWNLVVAYGAAGIGYIIPATYLPVMAREIVRSPSVFGWSWPAFGMAAFVSTLVVARLERRFSVGRIWAASQIVMAIGLLLPIVSQNIMMIIIAGLCVGGTFMVITMAGMKQAHRIAPPHDVMRHVAVMTSSFAIGQMIGPLLASLSYDRTGNFSAALVITSAALVITAGPLIFGSSTRENRHA